MRGSRHEGRRTADGIRACVCGEGVSWAATERTRSGHPHNFSEQTRRASTLGKIDVLIQPTHGQPRSFTPPSRRLEVGSTSAPDPLKVQRSRFR